MDQLPVNAMSQGATFLKGTAVTDLEMHGWTNKKIASGIIAKIEIYIKNYTRFVIFIYIFVL